MTKDKVLHAWFSQFLPAYPTSNVPKDAVFPWMTYELITGSWDIGEIALTVNLWYYTENEAIPNDKAQELSDAIGYGGVTLQCDGGFIWLKRGSPWCQSIRDESDSMIKRRYINVIAEYFTLN